MGLGIYTSTVPGALLSQGGAFTNPFAVSIDGRTGGNIDNLLYVRNDGVGSFYYTSITVMPTGLEVDGTNGYSWKLIAGNTQPSEDSWNSTSAANTISLANIGGPGNLDTSTYLPFWVRVIIPQNAGAKTYSDIQLQIQATQISV